MSRSRQSPASSASEKSLRDRILRWNQKIVITSPEGEGSALSREAGKQIPRFARDDNLLVRSIAYLKRHDPVPSAEADSDTAIGPNAGLKASTTRNSNDGFPLGPDVGHRPEANCYNAQSLIAST